jgi:putative hydrolase of the HAD superfamily
VTDGPVVCFDLGDVLVRLRFARFVEQLGRMTEDFTPKGDLARLSPTDLITGPRAMEYARGEIEPSQFFAEMCDQLTLPAASLPELVAAWCAIFAPWPEMLDLAERAVASGVPVWLLSNTDPVHMSHLRPQLPVLEKFQGLWLSYQTGTAKPDPAYYTGFCEHTGYQPAQCLFVDDRADNVFTAKSLGWQAIQHRGDLQEVEQFLRQHGVAV